MTRDGGPAFLTTKEVAELLRVKERKVYDLAAADEIPHRRITGKLLFPSAEIMQWIGGGSAAADTERPAVLTGSHDPLLDWALRESGCGLAALVNGSLGGLDLFAEGGAALCGMHLPEDDGWNRATVTARDLRDCVLIGWAGRRRGLILREEVAARVTAFADLRGLRVVRRQPEAGASALFDRLCADAGLSETDDLTPAPGLARTESDAAAAVAEGAGDAALGIEAMARTFGLPFLPLMQEQFDLLIDRRSYFSDPVQRLLAFARSDALGDKAAKMGGYDMAALGTVRWVSP